ncbi:very short patch repair endonuclease [Desulfococcaceae bacterium HSG9]|nr:very short patch repair endonuclease [Desulfococcaceae bacterium HSG9]
MNDVLTPAQRSHCMAQVKGTDTKPEIILRKALWKKGFRYRLHYKLPGRPDFVFVKQRVAIFVDGCFWHGCPIHYSAPQTREQFWKEKLKKNVLRDLAVNDDLKSEQWRVQRVWQHDLKELDKVVNKLVKILNSNDKSYLLEKPYDFQVAEPLAHYGGFNNPSQWWLCDCGSSDVRVLSVNKPGSLNPNAKKRPDSAELICCRCRLKWSIPVG